MAVASISIPGSTPGHKLGFDDYSLYNNLSDNELILLAIERSLSDAHNATSPSEASNTPTALGRRTVQYRSNPSPTRPNPPRQKPRHRQPTANPTDAYVPAEKSLHSFSLSTFGFGPPFILSCRLWIVTYNANFMA